MANAQRKREILAAALELFAERGYRATGMEDIASAVGMRASSLYNHVRSKDQVPTELCVSWLRELLETFDAAMAHAPAIAPAGRLVCAMRVHVSFHAENSLAVRVVNNEVNSLTPANRAMVTELRRDYARRFAKIVGVGVESGDFQVADLTIAVYALIDMGHGVARWFDPAGSYSAAQLGEIYSGFALGIVGYPATGRAR